MKTFNYQNKRNKDYFEGWYQRFITKDNVNFAVIFAVTKHKDKPHSFIQVFKDNDKECLYLEFPVDALKQIDDSIFIGKNKLSQEHLFVEDENLLIDIKISPIHTLENEEGSDSAMGYLQHAPLECFQEVIHLKSSCTGKVIIKNKVYEIDGLGYMEKTYGTNFPSRWIWIQSNHNEDNNYISFSVGKVPVLFTSIKGFFILLKIQDKLYRLSTYNFARIKIKENLIIIKKGKLMIKLRPTQGTTTKLVGPKKKGDMSLDVFESISATLNIEVYKGKKQLYKGQFENVGMELMY